MNKKLIRTCFQSEEASEIGKLHYFFSIHSNQFGPESLLEARKTFYNFTQLVTYLLKKICTKTKYANV